MIFGGKPFLKPNERQDKIYKFNIETSEITLLKDKLQCEAEFPHNS